MTLSNPSIVPISIQLTTQFHLPPPTIQICDKYYILYWQSRFLYTQLLASPRVVREKIPYVPVFLEPLSFQYLGAHPEDQVKVSFRRLRGKFSGHVLISTIGTIGEIK